MKKLSQFYNRVFLVFKNLKRVKTPDVNEKVLAPHGLPEIASVGKFREEYKMGRDMLR